MYTFPQVSLLITHYNRSESLLNLLHSYRQLDCSFGEIVVSDDGSRIEHLNKLKLLQKEFSFKLITTPINRGLGHNINKGQDAVTKPYTLYVQEDFEPASNFPEMFTEALELMDANRKLDIVKFYAYYAYPYLRPFNSNYSEMYLPPLGTDYTKIYFYTDHPHLRRSTFFQKFGRYPEGIKGDLTEYKMCISFLQNKGQGLFYKDFSNLFVQRNSAEEPSTMSRQSWKQKNGPITRIVRYCYRQAKYNYDILAQAPLKRV